MKHATTLSFARCLLAACAASLFVCAAPSVAQAGSVLDRIQSTGGRRAFLVGNRAKRSDRICAGYLPAHRRQHRQPSETAQAASAGCARA